MAMLGFPRRLVSAQREAVTPTYFQPSSYGTVYFWHRADDMADGVMSSWTDRSGNGNHLVPVSSGASSSWHTTRDVRRLHALVSPTSFLRSAALPGTGADARTIITVLQVLPGMAYPSQQSVWSYGGATAGTTLQLDILGGVYRMVIPATLAGSVAFSTTLPDVVIATYDGTTLTMYVNGASAYSAAQTLNTGSGTTFTASANIGSSAGVRALYYELAAFNAAVNSTVAGEINALLQAQYKTGR